MRTAHVVVERTGREETVQKVCKQQICLCYETKKNTQLQQTNEAQREKIEQFDVGTAATAVEKRAKDEHFMQLMQ